MTWKFVGHQPSYWRDWVDPFFAEHPDFPTPKGTGMIWTDRASGDDLILVEDGGREAGSAGEGHPSGLRVFRRTLSTLEIQDETAAMLDGVPGADRANDDVVSASRTAIEQQLGL